jgi:RecB family exonuclease
VITPRVTRLIRTPSVHAYQEAILALACPREVQRVRETAVLVPTRAAAGQLRRTLEDAALSRERPAILLPDLLTRSDYYERLRTHLPSVPAVLSPFDREVLLQASAHEAITDGLSPPFDLRPALIREILDLYDQLRRQQQTINDFARLLIDELEPRASSDRGAERMLKQTMFLEAAFRSYERRAAATGAVDEHGLRALLLGSGDSPYRHVVITTADRSVEPGGLWAADFDFLSRVPGIAVLDVIATDSQLAAGWHERVHGFLPGIEEVREGPDEPTLDQRTLLVPGEGELLHFTARDREEELNGILRRIKGERRSAPLDAPRLDRTAVVFSRPLPYLYLARTLFPAAGVPYQCDDALPLAAEPAAAAVDVLLEFVATNASRLAIVALLRVPQIDLARIGVPWSGDSVQALNELLAAAQYVGDPGRLRLLVDEWAAEATGSADLRMGAMRRRAVPAGRAALAIVDRLAPLFESALASTQLDALHGVLEECAAEPAADGLVRDRELGALSAVLATLRGLAEAYRRNGDFAWSIDELASSVRRWLESQTFTPRSGSTGVHLVDATVARYGRFDEVHLVGLVQGEWPERAQRNLFYSPFLLRGLGWADDRTRTSAARAAFLDLLLLASQRCSVSTFLLEEDSLVEPSALLDDVGRAQLAPMTVSADATPVFSWQALARADPSRVLGSVAERWLGLRIARSASDQAGFHGSALPYRPRVHSVTALELYVQCPFRYFSRYVLRLTEEPEDEHGLGARERGSFVHAVFQSFFEQWDASGRGSVTPASIEDARGLFSEVLERMLATLPPTDAALERARLLGSPVSPGIADLVFRTEAVRPVPVLARRLEDRFEGVYELSGRDGPRQAAVRGIVDRIDLLADGTLRVIDYKSSMPHKPVQLAVYAVAAEQRLRQHLGRDWRVSDAAYIIVGADRGVRPLFRRQTDRDQVLAEAQQRTLDAIDGIEQGLFPPRPVNVHLCSYCAYAGVCRKDYVTATDDPDTTPAV